MFTVFSPAMQLSMFQPAKMRLCVGRCLTFLAWGQIQSIFNCIFNTQCVWVVLQVQHWCRSPHPCPKVHKTRGGSSAYGNLQESWDSIQLLCFINSSNYSYLPQLHVVKNAAQRPRTYKPSSFSTNHYEDGSVCNNICLWRGCWRKPIRTSERAGAHSVSFWQH